MTKVSVVIVTFNSIQWIEKCLESIYSNICQLEIVIVDNGSTDGTIELLKFKYSNIVLIQLDKNFGFGYGNNVGIERSIEDNADYILLLNHDAWFVEECLDNLISAHKKSDSENIGVISPIHLNGKGDKLDVKFLEYLLESCHAIVNDWLFQKNEQLYNIRFVNAACWLIPKETLKKVGGFNPSFFHYGEDLNYTQRLEYHNLQVLVLNNSFICHDREDRTNNIYFDDAEINLTRKIILELSNPLEKNKLFRVGNLILKEMLSNLLRFKFIRLFKILKSILRIPYKKVLKSCKISRYDSFSFLNIKVKS